MTRASGKTGSKLVVYAALGGNLAINDPGASCPAAGVPRALRIDLSRSIPAESVVVAGGPP